MTRKLTTADLLFMQAQILFGSQPPIGTDPFSLQGIRSVDGRFNNISDQELVDQYGDIIHSSRFAVANHAFVHFVDPVYKDGPRLPSPDPNFGPGPTPLWDDNYALGAYVVDYSPRIISNLVADMDSTNDPLDTLTNPFVPGEAFGNPGSEAVFATPFNSLMTIFGQFFDHGVDFIAKGGAGSVYIPLLPNDVNYDAAPGPDFIPVTRASLYVRNQDGSIVQNLDGTFRQIVRDPNDMDPMSTALGHLVPGALPGDPPTFVPLVLGLGQQLVTLNTTSPLVDQSQTYGSSPEMAFFLMEYSDGTGVLPEGAATGRLVTGADGGMATWADIKANALRRDILLTDADVFNAPVVALSTAPGAGPYDYVRTGVVTNQMFLADIAHGADPSVPGYNAALLNAHYVAGDPRANENIALTAIHSVFHGEHNRLVEEIRDLILQQDQILPGFAAQWNNEQIFQAAKIANEMQYQHMVFEEFARRISPNIDAFSIYNVNLNPNITSEFANAVYRLGHSMLTDTVDMVDGGGNETSTTLVNAFLNPGMFAEIGAPDINKGMSRQMGNEIDEFVVDSVRNMLLGLPLDLAAINIARGREAGLPSLNEVRSELFAQTNLLQLKPYESWEDFGAHLLHPTSLINFIAAYATDVDIASARNAGDYGLARQLAEDALSNPIFMGAGPGKDEGYNDIDLWLGGLAEAKVLDGGISPGMLGTTFDFIFATQMLALQNGDRLYYLARIAGNLLDQIEMQTFTDLLARGGHATHINGDTFGTADAYIELSDKPNGINENLIKTPAQAAAVFHEVIGGTHAANIVNAGDGNDTVWGEGGADVIEGGRGKDKIYGGDGDDVITDIEGNELIRGGLGDDDINAGFGIDVVFGEEGNDIVHLGLGDDESFGGEGHDRLFGDDGIDGLTGDEGDDVLDGGIGDDALAGGDGNDILIGGAGVELITGGAGNDFLIGGANADSLDGGLGDYDVASYENVFATGTGTGLTIDMSGLNPSTGDALGDVWIGIEEVRGTNRNDTIIGDAAANVLVGNKGNDSLDGGDGDDTLIGGLGNDTLKGGIGIDTAVFDDIRAHYLFNGITVSHGTPDGLGGLILDGEVDLVSEIEVLEFADQSITTASLQNLPFINFANSTSHVWDLGTHPLAGVVGSPSSLPLVDATVHLQDGAALANHVATTGINLGAISVFPPTAPVGVRTFALAGTDAASFQIVTVAGIPELHFIGAGPLSKVNFEAKQEYNVTISVTDVIGSTALNIIVKVDDLNDNAPVVSTGSRVNVQEGTTGGSTGTVVYRAEANDRDAGDDNFVFTKSGADSAQFTFVNGELRFIATPNFENPTDANKDNIYEISVTAFDGVNTSEAKLLKIHVTDVDEGPNSPPIITSPVPPDPINHAENQSVATVVYDAVAVDPESDLLIWSIVDTAGAPPGSAGDSGYFTIDQNGDVRFLNLPDFENASHPSPDYYITVQVNDPSHAAAPTTRDIHIRINDVVETIALAPGPGAGAIAWAENQPLANVLWDFDTTAATGAVVWSLLGNDAARFSISATGQLRFNGVTPKNFEAPDDVGLDGTYNVTVRATDATPSFAEVFLAVTLTNVNEAPFITSAVPGTPTLWAENTSAATVVYDVEAADPDAGTLLSIYTLGGVDAGLFSVNSVGQIRFNSTPDFEAPADAGADNIYNITVAVSDGALSSAAQPVVISVTNVLGVTLVGDPGGVPTTDNLIGTEEPDTISGLLLADVLTGLGGNDNLDGGPGIDQMAGGAGSDTYAVDETLDVVSEFAGQGTDTVNATATYTLPNDVENLNLLGVAAINGTGNALVNIIVGNGAANVIEGGALGDNLNGGLGNDTLSYASSNAGVTVNIGANTAAGGHAQGDTISNFENLLGSAFADTLTGSGVANILDGGAGIDTLVGGGANDTYFVDDPNDVVTELGGGGTADVVNSTAASYTLAVNVENLILGGIGNINGTGNGAANQITGNAGNNIIQGLVGGDTLNGGDGIDTVSYASSNAAVTINLATNAAAGGHAAGDVISNFENVIGSGFGDTLMGSAIANVFTGGAGADTINGGLGIDTAKFSGVRSAYVISPSGADFTVNGPDGLDNVSGVELLQFADSTTVLAGPGVGGIVDNFDSLRYIASYPDLVATYGPNAEAGLGHFLMFGFAEGRRIIFDGRDYNNSYPDLDKAFGTDASAGLGHYLTFGFAEGRPIIDGRAYIASYSDLMTAFGDNAAAGVNHYRAFAAAEGRHVVFDAQDYINGYADLFFYYGHNEQAGLDHYMMFGSAEGRSIVDGLAYIASYSDLMGAYGADSAAGVGHYKTFGFNEGRTVSFDPNVYIAKYADVRAAFGSDLSAATQHFITTGFGLGRSSDNSGADVLIGSAAADILKGGLGADTVTGLGGADLFFFNTALGGGNIDTIVDFNVAEDRIRLDNNIFSELSDNGGLAPLLAGAFNTGAAASQADDRIIYDSATGALRYDQDGSGILVGVQFATLTTGLALTAANFDVV